MEIIKNTPFTRIYDAFLAKVTDDMYMEFTELDTFRMLQELLISAIFKFEFPRVNLNDYETFSFMDIKEKKVIKKKLKHIYTMMDILMLY